MRKEMKAREFNIRTLFEKELAHLWMENDRIKQSIDLKDSVISKLTAIAFR